MISQPIVGDARCCLRVGWLRRLAMLSAMLLVTGVSAPSVSAAPQSAAERNRERFKNDVAVALDAGKSREERQRAAAAAVQRGERDLGMARGRMAIEVVKDHPAAGGKLLVLAAEASAAPSSIDWKPVFEELRSEPAVGVAVLRAMKESPNVWPADGWNGVVERFGVDPAVFLVPFAEVVSGQSSVDWKVVFSALRSDPAAGVRLLKAMKASPTVWPDDGWKGVVERFGVDPAVFVVPFAAAVSDPSSVDWKVVFSALRSDPAAGVRLLKAMEASPTVWPDDGWKGVVERVGVENIPRMSFVVGQDDGRDVTMDLVLVGPGRFSMGFTTDQAKMLQGQNIDIANAVPSHEVAISKWMWFGKTEVTQQQWEAVMRFNRAQGPMNNKEYPAVRLSWTEAVDFCSRLSGAIEATVRLPSEAEWEYACRAGSDGLWSFGSDAKNLTDYARCRENSRGPFLSYHLAEAGAKTKANQWGFHDMHGSVWEWCSDWYGDSDEPWGSPSPYTSNSKRDPSGPTPLNIVWVERGGVRRPTLDGRLLYRVMRGGDYTMGQVYSASRSKGVENDVKFYPRLMRGPEKLVGVRVVLEADAKPEQ